jgi:hypothetical protein
MDFTGAPGGLDSWASNLSADPSANFYSVNDFNPALANSYAYDDFGPTAGVYGVNQGMDIGFFPGANTAFDQFGINQGQTGIDGILGGGLGSLGLAYSDLNGPSDFANAVTGQIGNLGISQDDFDIPVTNVAFDEPVAMPGPPTGMNWGYPDVQAPVDTRGTVAPAPAVTAPTAPPAAPQQTAPQSPQEAPQQQAPGAYRGPTTAEDPLYNSPYADVGHYDEDLDVPPQTTPQEIAPDRGAPTQTIPAERGPAGPVIFDDKGSPITVPAEPGNKGPAQFDFGPQIEFGNRGPSIPGGPQYDFGPTPNQEYFGPPPSAPGFDRGFGPQLESGPANVAAEPGRGSPDTLGTKGVGAIEFGPLDLQAPVQAGPPTGQTGMGPGPEPGQAGQSPFQGDWSAPQGLAPSSLPSETGPSANQIGGTGRGSIGDQIGNLLSQLFGINPAEARGVQGRGRGEGRGHGPGRGSREGRSSRAAARSQSRGGGRAPPEGVADSRMAPLVPKGTGLNQQQLMDRARSERGPNTGLPNFGLQDRGNRNLPASMRYNQLGAGWPDDAKGPNSLAMKFGMTDLNRHLDNVPNQIAGFPTQVHGLAYNIAKAQQAYVGLTAQRAIEKWSNNGRHSTPGYANNHVLTNEDVTNPAFWQAMAKADSGTANTPSAEQINEALAMVRAGSAAAYEAANPNAPATMAANQFRGDAFNATQLASREQGEQGRQGQFGPTQFATAPASPAPAPAGGNFGPGQGFAAQSIPGALGTQSGVAGNLASQLGLNNILSNPLSAGTQFADWGTVPGIETPSASPQTAETAHQTLTDVVSKDQTPAEAVQSALNNAANNGLNQTTTALMAAIAATTAAAQQGLGPQAAVQALVDKGMDPHQAQSLVGNILSRAAAENTTAFQTPGIANFLHGLTNQFTQLFSAPPGPPQDIAREAPFIGDVAAGKGNPAVSIETASGKGVHDISIETASGKGGLDNIAIAPASVSQAPNLSDLYAVATPDLSSQLGLNDININDFGPASPGFEASGPTETTFDVGPSQQVSPTAGPYATQYDAGPQAQLSPVENISPLPSVEINPQFLDPVGPSIELSPYSPSLSPTAPAPAPSPSSNPAISHAPPAAQLNNNQSAQILLAAGLPAQSLDAFASSGLSPRKLLQLL